MRHKIINFVKNETVLCAASVLALLSMLLVPPSAAYLDYIDFRVLALLFCLMLIVSGLQSAGVFERLMQLLAGLVNNARQLALVLVIACFLLSMWITNDVALITLVPFAIMVLQETGQEKYLPFVIVMQTVAANLGSMCTPVGNPQNLYLYTVSGMDIAGFLKLLFPYTAASFMLVLISCLLVKPEPLAVRPDGGRKAETRSGMKQGGAEGVKLKMAVYGCLFAVSMLTVLHILHYLVLLAIVAAAVAIIEPRLFREADYFLLLTFIAFFVFVGNIRQIGFIHAFLNSCVAGNEVLASVLASQVISNVPAAVLLSGFTSDYSGLLVGTNIGGLGSLIASMASLISYKLYNRVPGSRKKDYMLLFTGINAVYLLLLLGLAWLIA